MACCVSNATSGIKIESATKTPAPTPRCWELRVKKARDRGHEFMLEIVALIVGRYFRADDPVHERKRALLLEPLVAQQQALRDDMRTRHGDDDTPEPDPHASTLGLAKEFDSFSATARVRESRAT